MEACVTEENLETLDDNLEENSDEETFVKEEEPEEVFVKEGVLEPDDHNSSIQSHEPMVIIKEETFKLEDEADADSEMNSSEGGADKERRYPRRGGSRNKIYDDDETGRIMCTFPVLDTFGQLIGTATNAIEATTSIISSNATPANTSTPTMSNWNATSMTNGMTPSTTTDSESQNPWPYLHDYFEFVSASNNGEHMLFKCVKCLPVFKCYKAHKKSLFSLRSHITSIHGEVLDAFNTCVKQRSKEQAKKRRDVPAAVGNEKPNKRSKQLKMTQTLPLATSADRPVTKNVLEYLVFNFFVDNLLSLKIIESSSFVQLMEGASGSKFSMSRRTLTQRIEEKFKDAVTSLKNDLNEALYVTTTADAWSCWNKSYLGMTAHWLNPITLQRKKGVIACRRFKGKHSYDVLKKELEDIHIEFGIQNKTREITIDNGSNFEKAFRVFDEPDNKDILSKAAATHSQGEEEDGEADDEMTEVIDIATIVKEGTSMLHSESGNYYALPRYRRCATHTFNLVATTDTEKILDNNDVMNRVYKKVSWSAFSKAQALWNKQTQSTQAAAVIKYELDNQQFIVPDAKRWSSLYEAVTRLNKILENKNSALKRLCTILGLTTFEPDDVTFLKEYAMVMMPVAMALDVLQAEKQAYMGVLLPTVTACLRLLADLKAKNLSMCGSLATTVADVIDNRFGEILQEDDCLLAAAFHPHFKLKWLEDDDKVDYITKKMTSVLNNKFMVEMLESSKTEGDADEPEDYFFSLLFKSESSSPKRKDAANSAKQWLKEPVINNKVAVHPSIFPSNAFIYCFIKYNTSIPSSAAVQRLFFLCKEIMRSKHGLLSDKHFEMISFLKGNFIDPKIDS